MSYKLFENYLANALSDAEKEAFENRLKSDPVFKEDFELHQKVQLVIDQNLEMDLLNVINDSTNDSAARREKNNGLFKKVLISLLILGLLAGAVWMLRPNEQANIKGEEIFATYYKAPYSETVRGETKGPKVTTYDSAHMLIQIEEFKEACKMFENVAASPGSKKEEAEWFAMLCYFKINHKNSESLLEKIIRNKDHLYNEKAVELYERHFSKIQK